MLGDKQQVSSSQKSSITKVVIPAAGLGTRFLPATKALPKEMLPLIDKPVIQFVVEEAVSAELDDILIVTGRNKNALENHFDRAVELEHALYQNDSTEKLSAVAESTNLANIHYVRQKDALGLGHATLRARTFVGKEPFALMLGDEVMDQQSELLPEMLRVAIEHQVSVVALMEVPEREISKYGIAKILGSPDGRFVKINGFVEKPDAETSPSNLAIIGRYVLQPEIFEILENTTPGLNGEIQLTDALNDLAQLPDKVVGIIHTGKRYDTGNKLSYMKAAVELAMNHSEIGNEFSEWLKELN